MTIVKVVIGITAITAWMVFALSPGQPTAAGPANLDHKDLLVRELVGDVLEEAETFALPTEISVVDNHLVIVDRYAEQTVSWLDRATGDVIRHFGRHGEGPGEFAAAKSIVRDLHDPSTFWVFDVGLTRLTHIDPSRTDSAHSPVWPALTIRSSAPVMDLAWLPDGSLLATGFFAEGRLARFDRQGNVTGVIGAIPTTDIAAPPSVRQHAFRSTMTLSPDGSRIVLASRYAGLIEIFNTDGSSQRKAASPFQFVPRFEVRTSSRGPIMASPSDTRLGYLDLATTNERIYALFSGRTRAGYPGRANFGEYIHVFNWSGEFLHALELDAEVIAIAVDESASTLYAVRHLPSPAVLVYSLPEEHSSPPQS